MSAENPPAKVLLAHPGTQYAPHLARELNDRSLLHRFWTGFALARQGWAGSFIGKLPAALSHRLASRLMDLPWSRLKTLPLLDWKARRASQKIGDEAAYFERNRCFQERIPDKEWKSAQAVIGFDTSSWILARRSKAHQTRFILDQSIGHPLSKERVFEQLRLRFPAWSQSIPQKALQLLAVEREEHELADQIVVPSAFVKQTLVAEGVEAGKIHIIPFGTDLDFFRPSSESDPANNSVPVFLFVGSLSARKGVPVLLEAWRGLNSDRAELWLAGPGKIPTQELEKMPASVKILGNQTRQQVARLMQLAQVFVFPSHFEGLAQVQIEAQAAGLPLIATFEAGATELISEEKTGFVIQAGDTAALIDRMNQLIENPGLRNQMRQNAIANRDRLSWRVYGDRWASLLTSQ